MQLRRKEPRVCAIPVSDITPNPHQPRRYFEDAALRELAESIRVYGILQPLTVRKRDGGGYELIAGERRLRAACLAGLTTVPCLLSDVGERDASLLALVENLQRRDLHYLEEAVALARLITDFSLTQEELARQLGRSPSAIANKLRLLRLSPACLQLLQEHALTERHARALLRLEGEEERLAALRHIIDRGLNVAQSEAYIETRLQTLQQTPPPRRPTFVIKDVRLFLNSIQHGLDLMRRAGVPAGLGREDTDDEILLTIRIPKGVKKPEG